MSTTYAPKQSPAQKKDASSASSVLDNSSQSEGLQRKADMANNAAQRADAPRPNNTGMPDNLKSGIENLSGFSMDNVRVHYNSSKPATVQALAYTQGTDIHVAPGQEKHLPHEAWHVAQQMAGRVSPTTNINGMPVNDNAGLEHEANVMGAKAVQMKVAESTTVQRAAIGNGVVQRVGTTAEIKDKLIEIKKSEDEILSFSYTSSLQLELILINNRDAKKVIYKNVEYEREEFMTLLDNYNQRLKDHNREFNLEKEDFKELFKKNINIGTEFTFRGSGEEWSFNVSIDKMTPEEKKKNFSKINAAYTKVNEFADASLTSLRDSKGYYSKGDYITISDILKEERYGKADDFLIPKKKNAQRISFNYSYKGDERNWWFVIDIDSNCIELQTKPSSYNELEFLSPVINKCIFGAALSLGLKPDSSHLGGGGHISLDAKSSLKNSPQILFDFISKYTEETKNLEREYNGNEEYVKIIYDEYGSIIYLKKDKLLEKCKKSDKIKLSKLLSQDQFSNLCNDNGISEAELFSQCEGIFLDNKNAPLLTLEKVKKKPEKLESLKDVVEHMKDKDKKVDPHYQAINLEHINESGDKARIEMRRFNAQQNTEDLLNQVETLFEYLSDAYVG